MKPRLFLLLVAAILVALGAWSISQRGKRTHSFPPARSTVQREAPIQDGKTLDFSSGKAVTKDSAEDRAKLARSVAEMNAATADVTFKGSAGKR